MDDDEIVELFFERSIDVDDSDDSDSPDNSTGDAVSVQEPSGESKHKEVGPNVSYDKSLPALHSYLGTHLEELSGRTVLDDNSCQTLSLLALPGVVLIPGQTLPLQIYNPATVSMLLHIINNDRTFGIINSRYSGRTFSNILDTIGTTAEIRSFREEGDDLYGSNVLRIKAEGRQRFEILETRRQSDGMIIGKIRILPELLLGDPGECARLNSLDKFRIPPPFLPDGKNNKFYRQKYNKYDFANYTWFPPFVYKFYDPYVLMERIKNELKNWNQSDNMPCKPREFSYWVAANLPLSDNQRIALLSINDVIQRLRLELQILQECSTLRCKDCLAVIAYSSDIFSMSLEGPQGTYVNPNGYVHEAITVFKAKRLVLNGRPSTEQSWFPGYAWTIAECENCKSHMGWRFTAVDKNLKPGKFWGLCRSAIHTGSAKTNEVHEFV